MVNVMEMNLQTLRHYITQNRCLAQRDGRHTATGKGHGEISHMAHKIDPSSQLDPLAITA